MQIPSFLCLHTPRADCNVNLFQHQRNLVFASTRSVQIATPSKRVDVADVPFASTRSVQIATCTPSFSVVANPFASTRSVQIATPRFIVC